MRGLLWLVVGTVVFVAVTFFEQLPIIGWLGGAVSIAAWIALTRALVRDREPDALAGGAGVAWSGAIGVFTGAVGAFTAWLAQTGNLVGLTTPPGDRFGAAFGFVGSTVGLVYWPIVGLGVCVVTALVQVSRRPAS